MEGQGMGINFVLQGKFQVLFLTSLCTRAQELTNSYSCLLPLFLESEHQAFVWVWTINTYLRGMAWAGQLQKSVVSLRCCIHVSAKFLPCSCLFSAAHPAVSPQAFYSRMTFSSKEKLLTLQWGIAVWGIEVCTLLKLGWFVLAVLAAQ